MSTPDQIQPLRRDRRWTVSLVVLALVAAAGCREESAGTPAADPVSAAGSLASFAGGHARLVWVQDLGDNKDVFAGGAQLQLMGLDSLDGRGERVLLPGPRNISRPLITPDGSRVVFSDALAMTAEVVDWSGAGHRVLAKGMALEVWRDPASGIDWVLLGRDPVPGGGHTFARVVRVRLEDATVEEPVWSATPVGADNVQLSADGTRASAVMPWPACGVLRLDTGEPQRVGRGCWPALSPDNAYRLWIFDGAHRNLDVIDTRTGARTKILLADAPGIGGHEVYHPRWSNHPRYFVMTGPYTVRQGANNIRGGGGAIELYVGRFTPDVTGVEAWLPATTNDRLDIYPDLWVAEVPDPGAGTAGPGLGPGETEPPPAGAPVAAPAVVLAEVTAATPVPAPEDIAPYRQGLVAHEYRLVELREGAFADRDFLAAHWVIREGEVLPDAERAVGEVHLLRLAPYDDRPELEGERLSMDSENVLWPLYYDVPP